MNILRQISTISTITIIALATQFVFMLTSPETRTRKAPHMPL